MALPRVGQAPVGLRKPPAPREDSAPAAPLADGDRVVEKGDTLWKIAKQLVEPQGGKATDAQVARTLTALKAANPELCTKARAGGDKIYPGDVVHLPPSSDWQPRTGGGKPPALTEAGRATAQQQMAAAEAASTADAAKRKESLGAQLHTVAQAIAQTPELTGPQQQLVAGMLEQLKQRAPELLDTEDALTLAEAIGAELPEPEAGDLRPQQSELSTLSELPGQPAEFPPEAGDFRPQQPELPTLSELPAQPAELDLADLDRRAAAAQQSPVASFGANARLAAAADAAGNRDGQTSLDELKGLAGQIMARFEALQRSPTPDVAQARQLAQDYAALTQLVVNRQQVANQANEGSELAKKIDGFAKDSATGQRLGNGDGTLGAQELEAFIEDRSARANTYARQGNAQLAGEERALVQLARDVLVPMLALEVPDGAAGR